MATVDDVRGIIRTFVQNQYGNDLGADLGNANPNLVNNTLGNLNATRGLIVEFPLFGGSENEDVEEWVQRFIDAYTTNALADDNVNRFRIAKGCLVGTARDWLRTEGANIDNWGGGNNDTSLDRRIVSKYASDEIKERWQDELENIKQGDKESVTSYVTRFRSIVKKAGGNAAVPEGSQKRIFMKGLSLEYIRGVYAAKPANLNEAITAARNQETGIKAITARVSGKEIVEEKNMEEILKEGIIRESYSPWSSPVVIVDKKTGDKRFCIDFRRINQITITDAYPLPRIDDLLEKFRVAKWFTTIDLASGYWQIEMKEEDKEKTAFICSQGLYEFNVMPFGLKNAPAIFQKTMNKIFKEYLDKFMNVYIDDIIIYSKNWNEHLQHIKIVLEELRKANMMLKLKKCEWAKKNVEYLGHIVGTDGLRPDDKKIEKIKNLKPPKNIKQIREINGLCSYYRKFVKGYSKIVKPIMELTRKNDPFIWTDKQQKALEEIKERLINYPILQHPDFEKEFILITDASGEGLGAILEQLDENNREIVISYASRSLINAEKNYPITELECLAVFWGIKYFHKYLFGRKFKVITDHAALKGFMSTSKVPKGKRGRWMMELQQYDFEIVHRPGKENKNADAMSRLI
ncbi:unnamed protein product [Rhizophagus irregularis]|nr:unnamed protein product [Rhizophagus irregularis]